MEAMTEEARERVFGKTSGIKIADGTVAKGDLVHIVRCLNFPFLDGRMTMCIVECAEVVRELPIVDMIECRTSDVCWHPFSENVFLDHAAADRHAAKWNENEHQLFFHKRTWLYRARYHVLGWIWRLRYTIRGEKAS